MKEKLEPYETVYYTVAMFTIGIVSSFLGVYEGKSKPFNWSA